MLEFYSLREHPFGVSPDPRFLYPSYQHREAMASLIFGIESQVGFAALIAEPGSGKTTLLFDLLQRYRDRANTAFIFNTQCNGLELLRQVVLELEVPGTEDQTDPVRLHQAFTSFVASEMSRPVVIIIDEAQNLENSALETLRLLSNFEAADRKLLHIILAGQPQLADKLRHHSLTQLLQRITIVSRLERFSREQMEECIAFRLRVAGYAGSALFSGEALGRIVAASGGVPREVNRVCMNAMQLGFVLRQKTIGVDVIEEVLSDLTLAKWMPQPEMRPSAIDAPQMSHNTSGAFRVGASSASRPAVPRSPAAATDPWTERMDVASRSARMQPILHPNHSPDDVDPLLFLRDQPNTAVRQSRPPANGDPLEPSLDDLDPLRPLDDSGLRRALLDAAARRRRAAELRLLGIQQEEGGAPAAPKGIFPYKFAMGCIPNPARTEEAATADENEPFRGANHRTLEQPVPFEATQRADKDKKTGS